MNLRTFPFRLRRGLWDDGDPDFAPKAGKVRPQSDAASLAAELTVPSRVIGCARCEAKGRPWSVPDRDLLADVFEDGQAYRIGQFLRHERDALDEAANYLRTDPVHGARRAMLVLTGYLGMGAADVAEAVA